MNSKEMKSKAEGKNEGILLKPYTLKELSEIYGVCPRTLRRWMDHFKDELGPRRGRFYTIPQVKMILDNLNLPTNYDDAK